MDDIRAVLDAVGAERAVLDAVGAERAVLVGAGGGGQPCAMFAATYPERTRALVLVNTPARVVKTEDYPHGLEPDAWREQLREVRQLWGEREYFEQQVRGANPSADDEFLDWFVTCQRFNASPGAALNFYRVLGETDLRDVLASLSVPTLVLHGPAQRDEMLDVARRVPDARSVALPADTLIETFGDIARETRPSSRVNSAIVSPTRSSRRFCSRTSSAPRSEQPRSATGHGEIC
jgi:pimeloyl-ACP methyl ester carboxylesterase